jgi:hypothetical protein
VHRRPSAGLRPAITQSPLELPADGAGSAIESRVFAVVRYLDVLIVAVAAPAALILGAPVLGCVIGAAAWLGQRLLAQVNRRLIEGRAELQGRFGVNLIDAFGRIWLLAGAIVLAGVVGGRGDGLAASLMIFGAYSIAFALRLMEGRPGGPRP